MVTMQMKNKRHFLLLEVLIAFALIVLCILPLIYPHVMMLQAQRKFVKKVELDHVVNLLYANIYEQLQKNEIPWDKVENKVLFHIDSKQLTEMNHNSSLPYAGEYHFENDGYKSSKDDSLTASLWKLKFTFTPVGTKNPKDESKQLEYEYKIFIALQGKTQISAPQPGRGDVTR